METLTNPKLDHMLEAGIEVLHFESREWLSNISFWRGEAKFLQDIIEKKNEISDAVEFKKELDHVQNKLHFYQHELLPNFRNAVEDHEHELNKILENKSGIDDHTFREKHKELAEGIEAFEKEYKELKKEIFAL